MPRANALLQIRLDAQLKHAFVEAARARNETPSEAARDLISRFVHETHRVEAQRQSRIVASASDAEDVMDDVMEAQNGLLND